MAQKPNPWPHQLPGLPSNATKNLPLGPAGQQVGAPSTDCLPLWPHEGCVQPRGGTRLVLVKGWDQLREKKNTIQLFETHLFAAVRKQHKQIAKVSSINEELSTGCSPSIRLN